MAEESPVRTMDEETAVQPSMTAEPVEAPEAPQEAVGEPTVQTEPAEAPKASEEPSLQTEAAEAPVAPQEVDGEPLMQSQAAEAPTAPQEEISEPAAQTEAAEAPAAPQEMSVEPGVQAEGGEAPAAPQEAEPADGEAPEPQAAPVAADAAGPLNEAAEACAMEVDTPAQLPAEANTPPKNSTEMQEDTPEKAEAPAATPTVETRPLTPLFQFTQDRRLQIMQEYGLKKITEVAKLAKELFDALPPEERKAYEDDYERKKKAYQAWLAVQEGQKTLQKTKAGRATLVKSKKSRKASTEVDGKAAAAKPAAMKKKLAKAKPRSKAAQSVNKAIRPTRPVLQYMKENRYKIMTQHKLRRATELPKKAAELWNMLPWEQRKPYVDRFNEQNKAWLQFKASERTAIRQYERTVGTKAPAPEKSKKRSAAAAARPATASKARKTAAGKTAGAKAAEQHVILSSEAMEKAKKMGTAASGLPYLRLLEKLLSTPGLGGVSEEDALSALKRSKGIVNVARNDLKSNVIEV